VVFFGEVSRGLYRDVLNRNRVDPVGFVAIDVDGASDYLSPAAKDQAVLTACADLKAQGAEAVVICGAAIVGMAARLGPQFSLPVFDGLEAIEACLSPHVSSLAGPARKPLGQSIGLSPALTRLIHGRFE
ncbi:MAG: hypothetical protein AAF376_17250, partial [Pseudomonadota bacterium]